MLYQIALACAMLWGGFVLAGRRSQKDATLAGYALVFGLLILGNVVRMLWNEALMLWEQLQTWFWAIIPDTRTLYWVGLVITILVLTGLITVLVWLRRQ